MALIPFEYNDFLTETGELVTTQFEDKDVFNRYLRLLKIESQSLLEVFKDLMQKRDIDSATGAQLDIIGRIVGQSRTLASADLYPFFGFQGSVVARSFGTLGRPTVGGYWYSLGASVGGDVTLSDDMYRTVIKARIIKNNSRGTNADFVKFGTFVLNTLIMFQNDGKGNSKVMVGKRLTLFERAMMAYVFEGIDYTYTYSPKPLGVGIEIEEFDSKGTLGFIGTPRAMGMITLAYPSTGGLFADLYFD